MIASYVPAGMEVTLQSENGCWGLGGTRSRGRRIGFDQRGERDGSEMPGTLFFQRRFVAMTRADILI